MNFNRLPAKTRSSNRRHRITVERLTRGQDADGYLVTEKEVLGPYWASVNPVSEKQRMEYKTIGTECTHIIRCDAKLDIRETDQIIFKTRVFEILTSINLNEIERDKLIVTKEIRPKQSITIPASYTLTYTAGLGGSIVGDATQTVVSGEDGSVVVATPATGKQFVKWSDNNSTVATRQDFAVTANVTTVATFEDIPS